MVASFLEALDRTTWCSCGSDTGGAVSQLLLDEDRSRVGRLVLTNCDAFDSFPPAPFGALFRVARHPFLATALMQPMRSGFLRHSRLGFGGLVRRRLEAEESRPWVTPYLTDAGVRRDVTTFAKGWDPDELVDAAVGSRPSTSRCCCAGRRDDPFFKYALAKRLLATFPDATLVEFRGARTFVSLDQPERLAEEIVRWLH